MNGEEKQKTKQKVNSTPRKYVQTNPLNSQNTLNQRQQKNRGKIISQKEKEKEKEKETETEKYQKRNQESKRRTREKVKGKTNQNRTITNKRNSGYTRNPKDRRNNKAKHRKWDIWDKKHLLLPCSKRNTYTRVQQNNKKVFSKWDYIRSLLEMEIGNWERLSQIMIKINPAFQKDNLIPLKSFLNERIDEEKQKHFYLRLLPKIQELALSLPKELDLYNKPIPLLLKWRLNKVELPRTLIASLLACSFFCLIPYGDTVSKRPPFLNRANFTKMYLGKEPMSASNENKLKSFLHYFETITKNGTPNNGSVGFYRNRLDKIPDWKNSNKNLSELIINSDGLIEDSKDHLHVDFANKYVGGGVLGNGCVQEEIRYTICPELLVSCMICEKLEKKETLLMIGAKRYSNYKGYGRTFEFVSGYIDKPVLNSKTHCASQIIAIDAKNFSKMDPNLQFSPKYLNREIEKIYCGFRRLKINQFDSRPIATGNLGCGVYAGNIELKALLQLIAAAEANRNIVYFTFNNAQFAEDLKKIYSLLKNNKYKISQIWNLLLQYFNSDQKNTYSIFQFIIQKNCEKKNELVVNNENRKQNTIQKEMRNEKEDRNGQKEKNDFLNRKNEKQKQKQKQNFEVNQPEKSKELSILKNDKVRDYDICKHNECIKTDNHLCKECQDQDQKILFEKKEKSQFADKENIFVNHKPVLRGHVLVIPLRKVKIFEDLKPEEVTDIFCTAQLVCKALRVVFNGQAFNLLIQDGPQAGQTVEQVHLHILPRIKGDRFFVENNSEIKTEIKQVEDEVKPRSMEEMEKEAILIKRQIQIQIKLNDIYEKPDNNNDEDYDDKNINKIKNQQNEIQGKN
ncbi:poly(adp-ribose) glycohydrolase [Anaeramoeba flamelloides]|uniref:poly(ADP-ribose) glycohydrolase n=1 Tax=Anaeramoeba flamelloides TaxID=1746091 RepID=A0ABQ8ZAH0_9EUKA|nr:poly(adp-ribose) glycohydrolase [Anaeramoeba flamelloides]